MFGTKRVNDALKLAGYSRQEINCHGIRKSISKKKCWLLNASVKNNKKKTKAPTVVTITSTKTSSLSDLTVTSNSKAGSTAASIKDGTKVLIASGRKKLSHVKMILLKFNLQRLLDAILTKREQLTFSKTRQYLRFKQHIGGQYQRKKTILIRLSLQMLHHASLMLL